MSGGFYVYALIDPRDGRAFYIGKGCGKRAHAHVLASRRGAEPNPEKDLRIREIHDTGAAVVERVLRRFDSEWDALELERRLIHRLRRRLTNIAHGGAAQSGEARRQRELMLNRARLARFERIRDNLPRSAPNYVFSTCLAAIGHLSSLVDAENA